MALTLLIWSVSKAWHLCFQQIQNLMVFPHTQCCHWSACHILISLLDFSFLCSSSLLLLVPTLLSSQHSRWRHHETISQAMSLLCSNLADGVPSLMGWRLPHKIKHPNPWTLMNMNLFEKGCLQRSCSEASADEVILDDSGGPQIQWQVSFTKRRKDADRREDRINIEAETGVIWDFNL